MICILLGYLGYRRFCHRPKKKTKEATAPPPPSTCVTCFFCSPLSLTSLRPWDKEAVEDRYYASIRQRVDFDDFGFAPQHQRYERYEQLRRHEQRYEPRQPHYNRGRIVDPVEQL
jgi:hypothetical protein